MQMPSWCDERAFDALSASVVARVYFPFNRSELDAHDEWVLRKVGNNVQHLLFQGKRVELHIVGHADRRGSDVSNMKLGRARAKTVARLLQKRFAQEKNFNAFANLSSYGERYAHQGRATEAEMAADRRVDIWLTNPFYRLPDLEPLGSTSYSMRLVSREYAMVSAESAKPGGEDIISKGITNLTLAAIDKLFPVHVLGQEDLKSRVYRPTHAGYRVTTVDIETHYSYQSVVGGEVESWFTYVTYTWGPAYKRDDPVVIHYTQVTTIQGKAKPPSSQTKIIRQWQLDPFFNPPPLKSAATD
jgi:hypothetical protein